MNMMMTDLKMMTTCGPPPLLVSTRFKETNMQRISHEISSLNEGADDSSCGMIVDVPITIRKK
jgi:hypothetical protein